MARSGWGANFRLGHRTFLSVNEFHYLTLSGPLRGAAFHNAPVLRNSRKAVRGGNNALSHAGITCIVPSLADDDQFAARPILVELPGGDEWPTNVQPAMDQNAWDAC